MLNYVVKNIDGVKCYVVPKRGYVEKKAMVAFDYGSCDTEFLCKGKKISQTKGIAHFLEHKMFESNEDLFSKFERLGANVNAFTNFSTTAYHFNCTDNFKENFVQLLKMVSSLEIDEKSIEREKSIISQEINMYEDDIGWQVYFNGLKCAFSENNVRYSVAGTNESIAPITTEDLYLSYNSFYTRDNCCVIVAGDVDEREIFQLVDENLSLGEKAAEKIHCEEDEINNDFEERKMPVSKSIFNIDFRESIKTESIAERIALNEVLLNLLCGKSSHLYDRLCKKGLINGDLTVDYVCGKTYGLRIIGGESDCVSTIINELSEEIDRYAEYGVSDEYLKRVVQRLKNQRIFDNESLESICSTFADCFSKKIEVLDIYSKYDTIEGNNIIEEMRTLVDNKRVVSIVGG